MANPIGKVKAKPVFKKGDNATYKDFKSIRKGQYQFGGSNQHGFVGKVIEVGYYLEQFDCYLLVVTTSSHGTLNMAEIDFVEYYQKSPKDPFAMMLIRRKEFKLKNGTTKWKLKRFQS